VAEAAREVTGVPVEIPEETLRSLLSPEHFVAVRRTWGGPAPETTGEAIARSTQAVTEDAQWLAAARARLLAAESGRAAALAGMG
jgi:argininosuccinate lyase